MITNSKKAVIQAAAIQAFEKGLTAFDEFGADTKRAMSIMTEYKNHAMLMVCKTKEERYYFELCYLYGGEKEATKFALWSEGFWKSLDTQ